MHAGDEYEVYVTDSALFAPWLLLLIIGTFIIYGGLMVVSGDLSIASFLSTISMFQSLGAEFESLFQDSIFITSSYASIAQLTVFLNLPVDVPDRQKLSKVRRERGKVIRQNLRDQIEEGKAKPLEVYDVPADLLPIMLKNVRFSYKPPADTVTKNLLVKRSRRRSSNLFSLGALPQGSIVEEPQGDRGTTSSAVVVSPPAAAKTIQSRVRTWISRRRYLHDLVADGGHIRRWDLSFNQGDLVAIVGPPTQGKSTLMRLIAGHIFPHMPNTGSLLEFFGTGHFPEVFVPPHLRVVQVQETPLIMGPEESILENLTFGIKMQKGTMDAVAVRDRAKAIMEKLGLGRPLLHAHFETKGHLGTNGLRITRTERQLICIGRAFVMNPEVIIFHKPFALLDTKLSARLMSVFKEYIGNRGVCMDPSEPLVKRRRRTIVFTGKETDQVRHANVVYEATCGKLKLKKREPLVLR